MNIYWAIGCRILLEGEYLFEHLLLNSTRIFIGATCCRILLGEYLLNNRFIHFGIVQGEYLRGSSAAELYKENI